jgi:hypothetical protein
MTTEPISKITDVSASLKPPEILKFEQADWTGFRTVEGLQRKAGVPKDELRRLVLKELADNALDTETPVKIGQLPNGRYFIEDGGAGIDGTPEQIAALFSIERNLVTTKMWRLPTRGALGNGLRVVAGAVLASQGSLTVATRNRRIELRPERDGTTTIVSVKPVKFPVGTRIEIGFGAAIPEDEHALYWATFAVSMAKGEPCYQAKSSPWWYDTVSFHELLSASTAPVREFLSGLAGCTGGQAGEIVAQAGLGRMLCNALSREQAANLLTIAQSEARQVNPASLGPVGPGLFPQRAYAASNGFALFGDDASTQARIPFVVEAWVVQKPSMGLTVCVNRTPVASQVGAQRDNREIDIFGCGLAHTVAKAPKDMMFSITLNITTPYMPITSDGKQPDLKPFFHEISTAVQKAVRKARRPDAKSDFVSIKSVVLDNLDDVIDEVSGVEGYRFNARQLFYALRPIVKEETGNELHLGNFTSIITDYEDENGEIELMYREPRGSITHPHHGRDATITLGTLMPLIDHCG